LHWKGQLSVIEYSNEMILKVEQQPFIEYRFLSQISVFTYFLDFMLSCAAIKLSDGLPHPD